MEVNASTILQVLQSLVIFIGALWAFVRFRIELPTKPRIELDVDAVFLGPQQGNYIASISILIRNKGTVNHEIHKLKLEILGLNEDMMIEALSNKGQRVNFPVPILNSDNIIPKEYGYYFVRAGVQQTIHYYTPVAEGIRFVRIWAAFH